MNKILKIIIIVLLIVLILASGGFAFAYFFTDIFKSDKEMFFKYISQSGKIIETLKDEDIVKYGEKQQNTPYTNDGKITMNFSNTEESNNISQGTSITFSGNTDKANKYKYENVKFNYSDTDSIVFEYINMQDYYGIKIDDIVSKFIAVENNNLKQWATNMGLDEEKINEIPDKIDFDNMLNSKLFTDEEIETLKTNYKSILLENLTDEMFSKSESETSDIYTITLTESQAQNIISLFLDKVKNDEIIIAKIKQNLMQNLSYTEEEADKYIDELKDNIQEAIDENANNTESNTSEEKTTTINLYVEDKILTKIEITIDGDKISILNKSNGFSIELLEEGSSNVSYSITIEKNKKDDNVEYKFLLNDSENQLCDCTITFSGLNSLNQVIEGYDLSIGSSEEEMSYTYSNIKKFESSITQENITVDDMLFLNTAPSMTNIENLFTQIGNKFEEVNNNYMNKYGFTENPMTYYLPSAIPLVFVTGMQSSGAAYVIPMEIGIASGVSSVMMITLGNSIFSQALEAQKESSLLEENKKINSIGEAKDKVLLDLLQLKANYYSSETSYEGTLADYIQQNWVSSDESVYLVNGTIVTLVGTDISGSVQENGTIIWSDENSQQDELNSSINE